MAVSVRTLRAEEVAVVVEWMNEDGWNVAEQDVALAQKLYPTGFLAAEKDGQIVGCASAVKLGDSHGFFGSLMVEKSHRKDGLGRKLLESSIAFLQNDHPRNLGLFARKHLTGFYAKNGWTTPSWDVIAYRGIPDASKLVTAGQKRYNLVPTKQVDLDLVVKYDTAIHTIPRKEYIRLSLQKDGIHSYVALTSDNPGKIVGMATLQPACNGYRLAPLYADNYDIATLLLQKVLSSAEVSNLAIDSVEPNVDAETLAVKCGLEEKYRLQRMLSQQEFLFNTNNIYALANSDFHFA